MDTPKKIDRRRMLHVLGATTTLAACGGRPDTTDDGTPSDPDPANAASTGGTDAGGDSAPPPPGSCAGNAIAADASITPGGFFIFGSGRNTYILGRQGDGTLFGMSGLCTHARCPLTAQASRNQWYCHCHGARFDFDGNTLTKSIARTNLQHYEVSVCNGQVFLDPTKPV